jgi:hypothetical protein
MITYDRQRGFIGEKTDTSDVPFGFDWSDYLSVGETITSTTFTAAQGLTLSRQQTVGSVTSTFVAGGTEKREYRLACTIVTSGFKTVTRYMLITIKNNLM